jgi:hypothetical protein
MAREGGRWFQHGLASSARLIRSRRYTELPNQVIAGGMSTIWVTLFVKSEAGGTSLHDGLLLLMNLVHPWSSHRAYRSLTGWP